MQADPFVQDPRNSQSLNRYSYVLNNTLSYTDPSGYFFKELVNFAFAVVGVIVTPQNPYAWLRLAVSAGMLFGSTRQQDSIVPRGVVAAAFTNGFSTATSLSTSGVQHGAVQGTGGPGDRVRATTIGGTGSDQTGWKFANGAAMAGFAYVVAAASQGSFGKKGSTDGRVEGRYRKHNQQAWADQTSIISSEYPELSDYLSISDEPLGWWDRNINGHIAKWDTGSGSIRLHPDFIEGSLPWLATDIGTLIHESLHGYSLNNYFGGSVSSLVAIETLSQRGIIPQGYVRSMRLGVAHRWVYHKEYAISQYLSGNVGVKPGIHDFGLWYLQGR